MSLLTRAAATLAATAVVLAPSTVGAAHADPAAVPLPSADEFYKTGASSLASDAAGKVLGTRAVGLTLNDMAGRTSPAAGTQLVYRTQNELGQPSETVTTVIKPAGVSRGVVAYLSYYDGLGDSCDPSYTLRSSAPGTEKFVISTLVASGYTVTVPDFEGETLDWAAGHEAGWNTLDAIRATESSLGLAATTPVGLMGYSGGSIAGDWASELAQSYAPELNLVGTAIGGVPVNLAHVMGYVDSDATTNPARDAWAGVIPAAMVSLGRANDVDFSKYESTTPTYPAADPTLSGEDIAEQVSDECIADFAGTYPGLHVADLLADPGSDFLTEPDVQPIVERNQMGTGGTPKMPMLIVQGNKDGTGDGVMVAADVAALAEKYKAAGVPVTYSELAGADHTTAGTAFVFSALGFLGRVLPAASKPAPPIKTPPVTTPVKPPVKPTVPTAIRAKLKGHSKGHQDVLMVTAKGAAGADVQLFRAGHKKAIGHGRIHQNGKVTIKVKDRNGNAKTRYHAVVAATSATKAARTKVLRLR